ncbi:undecaprenyl-phosphate glucose phosphotransferase [Mucilaginibacter pallidiroseus]|uniref:Undecaprenyl-phosphate glucose phosphotransferase n=1 Tax=Mucilaginibacter pallidiroseus TaxID=2599295 RepID=A0A563U8B9_9SPHI|nr:undecaprenyl-phosphate glucose phosphotransferase [Mucilaginibacter pallidiroseus]TWR27590.1 undecaprenyl-phosphate glucose phosphotransferase [Mucilaginibacter pallidiroseus]
MLNRYATFIKSINLTVDYMILNLSMVIAYYIVDKDLILWFTNKSYLPIVLVFNLTWLLSANITRLYDKVLNKDSVDIYRDVIKTYLLFLSLICSVAIVIGVKAYFITRGYLIYSSAIFGVLLFLWKLVFLTIRKRSRSILYDTRRAVIVGSGRISNDLQKFLHRNPDRGYQLVGYFDDNLPNDSSKTYLGNINDCIDYVLANSVDEIFCTLPVAESEKISQLLIDADKNLIRFKIVPEYFDYGSKPLVIQSFGHIPIISVRSEPLENMLNRFLKRVFDIGFSLFVIIFLFSWLYPILAVLIKMESKGPVLFKQLRSGRDNNPFWCYKFRSMKVNKDSDTLQATRNDSRITKLGSFMRRTSIDELPQFFNVLMGNMSIVGPRPHMLSHTEQYGKLIDKFMIRHFLKPGITGYAQIKGLRGETRTTEAMQQRVEADVWYLENWSFLLDMKIIFLTIWNSVRGEENAF